MITKIGEHESHQIELSCIETGYSDLVKLKVTNEAHESHKYLDLHELSKLILV